MKKIKIGISILLFVIMCLLGLDFLVLLNYLSALFLHELAHLFVAIKRGYKLKRFHFDIFGMSVELNEDICDKDSFAINIAGPAFNLLICMFCMSMYWLVPASYDYLNVFCLANFVLAIFNLLPIYPLDGGKIFRSLIHSDKVYRRLDLFLRIGLSISFLILFIISINSHAVNYFYIIMVVFFLTSICRQAPTFSIFKHDREKTCQKIVMIKVDENMTIFSLVKKIKKSCYTIFYCNSIKTKYLDEDYVIHLAARRALNTKLKEID